jgi:hypothetical protein
MNVTRSVPFRIGAAVLALALAPTTVTTAIGQDQTVEQRVERVAGLKAEELRRFLTELKARVAKADRRWVCGVIQFPLKREGRSVRNATQCRSEYSAIFGKSVVEAIVAQQFEALFVNARGVMIGDGEVWIAGVCRDSRCQDQSLRIIAVNPAP